MIAGPPYLYVAYGLVIRSDLPFPELEPAQDRVADVQIVLRPIQRRQQRPSNELYLEIVPEEVYFEYSFIGRLILRGTSIIEVDPNPDIGDGDANLALLGAVMGLLLQKLGMLALHGGSVECGRGACVFLGDKGAGKSTLVAAMIAAGRRLLADDVSAIRLTGDEGATVIPGYPQVKIDEKATSALDISHALDNPVHIKDLGKRRLLFRSRYCSDSRPLLGIYVLRRGVEFGLTRMAEADAFRSVLRYSYGVRFGPKFLQGATAKLHMRQCASLASFIPVYILTTPSDIGALTSISKLLPS